VTTLVVTGRIVAMVAEKTRLERFLWVIDTFSGAGHRRPFDRLIGIKEGTTAVLVGRLEASPDGAGFDSTTMTKIMRATGVNPMWLLFGEGPRTIDTTGGDPELATFLATLAEHEDLKAAAFKTHCTIAEVSALLALFQTRGAKPFSTREGGAIDWEQTIMAYRMGKLRPATALPNSAGVAQARAEQGKIPKKVVIPQAPKSGRALAKSAPKSDKSTR
jgi:hypothetical protein